MADTFSALLGLRYQQTGGNDNTWGDLLNTDVFAVLENAVAGRTLRAVTGGTLDLSASPLVAQTQVFTGILSSDQIVIVPALDKRMMVQNATTGAFALLMKTSGGTTVCIPRGTFKDIIINAGGVLRVDANDVGEIKFFAGASVPAGYYECDGSAISRASNPDLFAAIGTTHGSGNGATTFNLPDLKTSGRFLRSRSASVAAGIYQNADIAAHNHTATGSTTITSITIAADGAFSPTITINDPTHGHIVSTSSDGGTGIKERNQDGGGSGIRVLNYTSGSAVAFLAAASATGISATSTSIGNHSHSGSSATATTTVTVNNSTGTETRPVNASAIACIRY